MLLPPLFCEGRRSEKKYAMFFPKNVQMASETGIWGVVCSSCAFNKDTAISAASMIRNILFLVTAIIVPNPNPLLHTRRQKIKNRLKREFSFGISNFR
jgi:hypothetical protein